MFVLDGTKSGFDSPNRERLARREYDAGKLTLEDHYRPGFDENCVGGKVGEHGPRVERLAAC